jgi:nitroreductase
MELRDALATRHMVRCFLPDPLEPGLVDRLLDDALRAPTAGNTAGVSWLALEGDATATYWEHTTTADWRGSSRRWPGLRPAPAVAVSLFSPAEYERRYREPDKQRWGAGTSGWPVPYWVGDAAFTVLALLLGATDAGLGACFLGNFRGEEPLLAALGVPSDQQLFGAVVLGHPAPEDPPSASLGRAVPSRRDRVHRGRWGSH